ncbi:hypothetical protein EIP86_009063 [Pleurotus ostreatoroseus]|nr:hypothetical protein EIP86_009063 [Pleurotus ostreatoroseus]
MPIVVKYLDNTIYRSKPAIKQLAKDLVEQSWKVMRAERNGATEAVIRGGGHESWSDYRFHWTVSYHNGSEDEVWPRDHVECPPQQLPVVLPFRAPRPYYHAIRVRGGYRRRY